ncbi:MAG: SLC45 family MFS transporter [Clostridiales bacterium]|nr:SLC45 family MFS transporter [Clostridiales bacterium]
MEDNQVAQRETNQTKDWSGLKLNYPRTIKVGLGFCVVMIFWTVYNFVVPLLLEQAFGFSNTIRNIIVGIASALCIFLLPFFGKKSDKCKSKYGRRTPFIVVGTAISIIAMVLIPLSVNGQLSESHATRNTYKNFFLVEDASVHTPDGTTTREELLGTWWDKADKGDFSFVEKSTYVKLIEVHGTSQEARAYFTKIYNAKVDSNDNGFLGFGGKPTKFYKYPTYYGENNELERDEKVAIDKKEYNALKEDYSKYLKYGADEYTSNAVNSNMKTGALVFFIIALLLVIISQTIIRTPAVSLMPDVTPSPLRSPGNAMINLIGGVGGAVGFLIYTITFMFEDKLALPTQYWIIFGSMAVALGLVLALFILLVKENKWVKENQLICEQYGLETGNEEQEKNAPRVNMFKQYGKAKMTSFFLILGSISLWFIGYYAISTNLAIYAVKVLELGSGLASIVSGASMLVAAIGFIPVGILARKIGRRWSIILGFGLAIVSFILVGLFVTPASSSKMAVFTLCYLISGFGLIFANVNTLPMVLELSTPRDVGKFTGYYYVATMTAQTLGPIFGGLVMDYISSRGIFFFSAICITIGAILMLFVKHGESPDFATKGKRKAVA